MSLQGRDLEQRPQKTIAFFFFFLRGIHGQSSQTLSNYGQIPGRLLLVLRRAGGDVGLIQSTKALKDKFQSPPLLGALKTSRTSKRYLAHKEPPTPLGTP